MAFTTGIELPVVYYIPEDEEDVYEYGTLHDEFFLWTFNQISSYGKCEYLECRNGTMFVSDGMEYFTYYDIDTFRSFIAQARYADLMNNNILYHKN